MFAEVSSIERPHMSVNGDKQAEILDEIRYTLGIMAEDVENLKTISIQNQRRNELLEMLIIEIKQSNDYFEHLLWSQDHKLDDKPPKRTKQIQ